MSVSWSELESLVKNSLPVHEELVVKAEQPWVCFRRGRDWFAIPLANWVGPLRPAIRSDSAAVCTVQYQGSVFQFEVDDFEAPRKATAWVLGSHRVGQRHRRLGLLLFEDQPELPSDRRVWAVGPQYLHTISTPACKSGTC